ncbi:hypothetical protein HPB48_025583 [Haemaphysalis longicornis]|uniref:Uncharacterized protein n=1 Tax=Haemaphysalis longicornis TaxID=44386 RepID=A0A9J6HAL5_HAELO|nr:hypothetical protein HPB48_025583 [Haemaphysalis longicornis]
MFPYIKAPTSAASGSSSARGAHIQLRGEEGKKKKGNSLPVVAILSVLSPSLRLLCDMSRPPRVSLLLPQWEGSELSRAAPRPPGSGLPPPPRLLPVGPHRFLRQEPRRLPAELFREGPGEGTRMWTPCEPPSSPLPPL